MGAVAQVAPCLSPHQPRQHSPLRPRARPQCLAPTWPASPGQDLCGSCLLPVVDIAAWGLRDGASARPRALHRVSRCLDGQMEASEAKGLPPQFQPWVMAPNLGWVWKRQAGDLGGTDGGGWLFQLVPQAPRELK